MDPETGKGSMIINMKGNDFGVETLEIQRC